MEDVLGKVPPERAKELRPLIIQQQKYGHSAMLRDFDAHWRHRSEINSFLLSESHPSIAEVTRVSECTLRIAFQELLALGAAIGAEIFDPVCEAVFDPFDEIGPVPGTPDLLVWHPKGLRGEWFFCEVKAPGDALRASQKSWLLENFDTAKGHFLLTILE